MKTKLTNLKRDWKKHLKVFGTLLGVFLFGIIIGSLTTTVGVFQQITINTISGIVNNLPWFILIYIGISTISSAIKEAGKRLVKGIPEWINKYETIKRQNRTIERAMGVKQ